MPELPEVETIKRTLEARIKGLSVVSAEIFLPKLIRMPGVEEFKALLTGRKFLSLERRGKYLLLRLSHGLVMVIHLRMTGRLVYLPASADMAPHTHLIINLDDGCQMRYSDIRRFGTVSLVPASELDKLSGLRSLGKEPFDREFTRGYLLKQLHSHRVILKTLLLDQSFIAGLGNIYADEVLFRARIHPQQRSNMLTQRQSARLFHAIREVLTEGIENRGTTLRDYVDGEGMAGNYQNLLKVHNRENQPCSVCSTNIVRLRISGRSTYFCPYCQRM
jgi:formamidopyrimidine-DNA glycosylase